MSVSRALGAAWKVLTHPAFWLPIMLVAAIEIGMDGLRLDVKRIMSDGWGYYLPLPAIFVYGDPHLTFLNRLDLANDLLQYRSDDGRWQGMLVRGSGYLNKYAFGTAVLQFPFFLIALFVSHFRYASINGFEAPFQLASAISGAFYFGLGSFLIFRTCRSRFDVLPSTLAVAAVILASNILHYATTEASFSHVYGYCLVAALMYLTVSRAESMEPPSLAAFVLFGIVMGLAVMTRPTNAVFSLLFIVFARRTPIRNLLTGTACALLASVVAASPQMIWWYATTGQPIYYSYDGEGFNFASPELRNYLISIRKGLFFWHPLYLLMFIALLTNLARRPLECGISAMIVALAVYAGASWSSWYFGHSFGSRNSIELLPVLAVPLASAIAVVLGSRWRGVAAAAGTLLIVINLIQFRGYFRGTIPHDGTSLADYAKFWALTLRVPAIQRLASPSP